MHRLRLGTTREWDEFPEAAESDFLEVTFDLDAADRERSLVLRQRDVKQLWNVVLNDRVLRQLVQDENDLTLGVALPVDALVKGTNRLRIEPQQRGGAVSDDVEVGELVLHSSPLQQVLSEAELNVHVIDADSRELLPCRLTLTTADGSLAPCVVSPDDHLAVRTGVVYSLTGEATIRAPAGKYVLYAGRGFEYGLTTTEITLEANGSASQNLQIQREVQTPGYVACDTHIHTLTYSGHGDATIAERMATLAGEGIELAIATDHNLHVDYEEMSRKLGARQYFTPVIGNEVTTGVGHFNVFPVRADAKPPNADLKEWSKIFDEIYATPNVKIAILNHARDLHSGVRPFGPKLHNWVVGQNLESWDMRFNGMEIINSGATQNEIMQLPLDWMALLNRGLKVTPVGSSDSHDVARFIVGQGRTYIRCNDVDPANVPVDQAIHAFLEGRVIVSYGLLLDMHVNDRFGPGDLVPGTDDLHVVLRVQAPHWIRADHVALYANGQLIRDEHVNMTSNNWTCEWIIERPAHDVHLVAIATGPGVNAPYWPTAKPYQPTSTKFESRVMSCTGAVWIDVDGDGSGTPARQYADRIYANAKGELPRLIEGLRTFDAAVAAQTAQLFIDEFGPPTAEQERQWLSGSSATADGYQQYLIAWRASQLARAGD
jgi:hypothetical protein